MLKKILKVLAVLSIFSFILFSYLSGWIVDLGMADSERKANLNEDRRALTAEPLVTGLINPWGMVFLPNGDLLFTEKSGELRIVKNGKLLKEKVKGVPQVLSDGQGGLLDIALHPNFKENSLLYLSYSSKSEESKGTNTAILKAKFVDLELKDKKVIYHAEPLTTSTVHFGSRIVFDKQGYLYFSIGDRGERDKYPQNTNLDGGKIYRLHDDGRIPEDNPFISGEKPAIYTYGNRNPQGLSLQPETGLIWEHEHGPRGGDEINIIQKGKNYGWPIISYGINYSGTKFAVGTHKSGMEQPISYWTPSIAPCGMTFIKGNKYFDWEGDLIVGSLKFGHLVRVNIEGTKIINQEKLLVGIGRVRNVVMSPEGYLYASIEGKGIYKLLPKEQ